jgi:hypothetical protein
MPFVPEAQYDVFISYAHIDNNAVSPDQRWVSRFKEDLFNAVRQQVGSDKVEFFFDEHSSRGHHNRLVTLLEAARGSIVFVPVLSPSYIDPDRWTMDELDAFLSVGGDADSRILPVEILPPADRNVYPDRIGGLISRRFFVSSGGVAHRPLTWFDDQKEWYARITDVAGGIKDVLLRQRRPQPEFSVLRLVDPARTVVLAETTDDLEEEREQVRRYLEQYGITVLPARTYPQGGSDFVSAVHEDLARANHFVQILGRTRGRRPPDLPDGYILAQHDAARAEVARRPGFTVLGWRRPDLAVDRATHPDARAIFAQETLAMTLTAFQAEIVRRVELARHDVPSSPPRASEDRIVFINADTTDVAQAKSLQEIIREEGFDYVLSLWDGPREEVFNDLKANIKECDILLLVYGIAEPAWVRQHMFLYRKIKKDRTEPPLAVAVCHCPPDPKRPLDIVMSDFVDVHRDEGRDLRSVRDLLRNLRSA